jgi:hypothetical protein
MALDTPAGDTRDTESRFDRLLHKDHYHPSEAAYLLGIDVNRIFQEAFARRLHARIVGHDVVSVSREALIAWLERDGTGHEVEIDRR